MAVLERENAFFQNLVCLGSQCYLQSIHVNVSEIAYLLVLNKSSTWTFAIDLNVYSKNQQFRLFDSIKNGKNNPFRQSNLFPFSSQSNLFYDDILTLSRRPDFDRESHFSIRFIRKQNIPQDAA
ncbi:hypothetical protein I4U23_016586 [Adineta vaga]|nr:hypothetical protein I4U23_016586 [Adineta vaga]